MSGIKFKVVAIHNSQDMRHRTMIGDGTKQVMHEGPWPTETLVLVPEPCIDMTLSSTDKGAIFHGNWLGDFCVPELLNNEIAIRINNPEFQNKFKVGDTIDLLKGLVK